MKVSCISVIVSSRGSIDEDRQAGERQRERDRHAHEHEQEEHAEQDQRRHARRQHANRSCGSPEMMLQIGEHLLAEEKRPSVTPVTGQATWISQSGSSASSEVRFQAKRVNSMPAETKTQRERRARRAAPSRRAHRLAARRQLRPDVDLEMRDFRARRSWRRS